MSEDLEKIMADYLANNLKPDQLQEFERRLKEDPQLREEVSQLTDLDQGLRALALDEFKQEVRGWERMAGKSTIRWRPMAIAASLLLLLIPVWFIFQESSRSSEDLFIAYYQPYEEVITSRGADDSAAVSGLHLLTGGLEAYNDRSFQQCAELLSEYLKLNPAEHRVALYLAIAQLELGLQQAAEINFEKAQLDPAFRQQAQWYQALSYLKFSDIDKASQLLSLISAQDNHYRRQQASTLLKELSD